MNTTLATRTTAQVLAQQQRDVERTRPQGTQSTAIAVQDKRTALASYLDEVAPSAFSGRLVKFNKDGKFEITESGAIVDENADFIALCDETLIGWLKFNGENAKPDRIQGLLYEGFVMPLRETLGDTDRAQWEAGLSGAPQDPWQHQMNLVLQEATTQEIFTFSTSSVTGRRAVGNLLRHYERLRRKDTDLYPIVRLKPGGFQHKDPRIGWVAVPQFVVVGKAPRDSAAKPDTSIEADMNDALPF